MMIPPIDKTHCCHGLQKRAIQLGVGLFRRVDTRRLDGPVKPGHDKFEG